MQDFVIATYLLRLEPPLPMHWQGWCSALRAWGYSTLHGTRNCGVESEIMATATISIAVRDWPALEPYKDRLGEILLLGLTQIRIEEALLLYKRGIVSIGRAAEEAGVTEDEMVRHARVDGLEPRFTDSMASEELA